MNSLYQTLSRINQIQTHLSNLNSKNTFNSKSTPTTSTAPTADEVTSAQNLVAKLNSLDANSVNPSNPLGKLDGLSGLGGINSNLNATFINQLQNQINSQATSSATQSQNLSTLSASTASPTNPYDSIINAAADRYNLPKSLIKSVIAVESNFNHQAVSPKGAMGLMQLMPATADQYNVKEPYSPEENILAGTAHLRKLLDRNDNNLIRALAAYNAGEGTLKKETVPNYQETQNYIKRVLDNYMKNNGVKL